MSNFVFSFNASSLAVAAELTKRLEMFTGATNSMDDNHIGTIYHEVAASKASEFLKFVHDLNEAPITDADTAVKYLFNVSTDADQNGLNDMIGDLKNWHVKESGNGSGGGATYANQLPANSLPDQSGDDAARDADAGTENKYPFSYKIIPMRVTAAYGSNLTDLLENEAELQADANTQIDTLKTNLLSAFGAHNNQSHDVGDGVENYGKKILRQAINQAQGSTAKSDRLVNMFKSDADNTSVDDAGNQVTNFTFEADDEIKFFVDLKTDNLDEKDQNTLENNTLFNEPVTYRFLAHLKFTPDYYYHILTLESGQIIQMLNALANTSRESGDDLYLKHNLAGRNITWDFTNADGRPRYMIENGTVSGGAPANLTSTLDNDQHLPFLYNGTNVTTLEGFVSSSDLKTSDAFAQFMMESMTRQSDGTIDLDATKFKRTLYAATGVSDGVNGSESEVGEIIGFGYESTKVSLLIRAPAALTTNHQYQNSQTNPLYFKNTITDEADSNYNKRYYLNTYYTEGAGGHAGELNLNDGNRPRLKVLNQNDYTNKDTQGEYRIV